ncbi:MAG: tetratricopeptide repeat protein [Desulfobacteraceae bacterium]|nr:tetratricopeptide repeat protein [Desulfobacteraceae bacterium]
MTPDKSNELNADELLHLALHAMNHGMAEKAIIHLKRLLEIEPENGKAFYLLGAVHAQIGMYDTAKSEMARALEIEPDLHTARFQLGLLFITSGQITEAQDTWEGLDKLGDQNPLFLFKEGMIHLIKDDFEKCAELLKTGIELNTFNEDLNNDMRRVLQNAEEAMTKENLKDKNTDSDETFNKGQHILLSAYKTSEDDS